MKQAQSPSEVLTPIPGEPLDQAAKAMPAGTAYYGFIAMFSLLAFAYGVAATLSADAVADWLTGSLQDALPGLVGDEGIDPGDLARIGRTTSLVGLVLLLVSGAAVMSTASESLHQIYGAPPDGRNPVARRIHFLMWPFVLGPLLFCPTRCQRQQRVSAGMPSPRSESIQ